MIKFLLVAMALCAHGQFLCNGENNRPIIGILSEELTDKMIQNYGPHDSFIAASYVNFIQGAGGRVVPLLIGQNESYYREIIMYINGVLLPGGSVWFDDKVDGYVSAGRTLLKYASKLNNQGDYFPVWATCLGFELITYLENNEHDFRVNCSAYNETAPLNFKPDYERSKLFSEAPSDVFTILSTLNSTTNFHRFCITEKDFNETGLVKNWTVLSTNIDDDGLEYISTIEHKTLPYFGTQWHPEKPIYEWGHHNTPHDRNSIKASQYFADFFVNLARNNQHSFPDEDEERKWLIYNYPATFGHATSTYTQLYFFN